MPVRLAVIKTLQQDVLGNHRWDERTRSYTTMPIEGVWAVESAMTAILERMARVVDWPRLLLEATQRHGVLHPETEASYRDWTPDLGVCRECMVEALLSDQKGATNWVEHSTTPRDHDQVDWPSVVAAHLPYRAAAAWHPYDNAPAAAVPATPSAGRVDVVVDRDPDNGTTVTVYIDGSPCPARVHVLDPGLSGADHTWRDSVTTHEDAVPQAVRDKIEETAETYHDPQQCTDRCA